MAPVRAAFIGSAQAYRDTAPALGMFVDNRIAFVEGLSFTAGSPQGAETGMHYPSAAAMIDALSPEALLVSGDAVDAVLPALERNTHILLLYPQTLDPASYRKLYSAYKAADYIKKKRLFAVHLPMLADSKLTLLKKVMQSSRIGKASAIEASAGFADSTAVIASARSTIGPALAFLSNTANRLDYRFARLSREGTSLVPSKLHIEGDGIATALSLSNDSAELILTVRSASAQATWRETELSIVHDNGFKEHYTYAESDSERSLKAFSSFFDFIGGRTHYVHCPLEDLYSAMQLAAGLTTLTGASEAVLD